MTIKLLKRSLNFFLKMLFLAKLLIVEYRLQSIFVTNMALHE